jgi:hypothetical protein
MAATTLYNAAVAANTTVTIAPYSALTVGDTAELEVTGSWAALTDVGLVCTYAVSIDGGTTYGPYIPLMEVTPQVPTSTELRYFLSAGNDVDHISVQIQNRNQALAVSNVKVIIND